ncbi:N-acetyl-gamma-glutamyl-phosphate reductase [Turneriella parva]|uniref:N-acetyl-gamma-glutamyl-phosphate reductase n=1 Tax=Turneriella parva (strain ATCC BAA-1111 / DSM 21527 / NCTC 11395 / H) TaxID=869212 RepID=I4B8P3_TURPD|nr:N-acetyl-gamma-glutamyl-phosphate reductase [Turneriella parva]AFM13650.1 N-acetyl-gamma-glutamyl-phosphate reductase [Turneriella parva DSM 21527]
MNNKLKLGILGAGGFTGQELIRILSRHDRAELAYLTSSEYAGKKLVEVFPALLTPGAETLAFSAHPQVVGDVPKLDAIFLATPDEVSLKWAPLFVGQGIRVIDIAGAFRLKNSEDFKSYYGLDHNAPAALAEAVYGMPETSRAAIKTANLVANPGCYPTAALLPLYVYRDLIDFSKPVIVDAKSGTSGAGGRKEKDGLGYSTVYENFRAYKTAKHQHAPEIAQQLALFAGQKVSLRFTPYLLPMYRGILSTAYIVPKAAATDADFRSAALAVKEPFLRYRASVDSIELKSVQHTNFCEFSHHFDAESGLVEIVSAIDNLMKGAAGQAVQNMNLMFGLEETTGVY